MVNRVPLSTPPEDFEVTIDGAAGLGAELLELACRQLREPCL